MVMYRDLDGCTFELSINQKNRNHLNLNSMKTLTLMISLVLLIISSDNTSAQNPINNAIQVKIDGSIDCPIISWNNKKETNTSFYVVEYSYDNLNFKTLSMKKALGQSNFPVNYNFAHVLDTNEDLNRMRYYRVVLVLMGGNRVYSETKAYIPIDTTLDKNVIANLDK